MSYSARTIAEAVRRWQHDALPHVSALSRELGIDFNLSNRNWDEDGREPGLFHKNGERDTVAFIPYGTDRIKREIGDIRPVGNPETKLAVVDTAGPNDFDTVESLSWERGTSLDIQESTSETYGWSVTVTAGFEVGGDAAGGKVIGGLELGTSGEYSKERVRGSGESWGVTHTTQVDLPKGQIAKLMQTVRVGPVEIDVEDRIVLKLGWRVADWRKPNNDLLKDHAGFAAKGRSKSRWHWDCPDTQDFRLAMDGANPRYPRIPRGYGGRGNVRSHVEWLMNEGNRTIVVKSKAHAEQGVFGDARVVRLGLDGRVLSEEIAG